jgi:mycoredoxin-dependent peroxiredoxin
VALEIGRAAPPFTLTNQHGQDVSLSDYLGVKNVAVLFYPSAFSSTCTGELSAIRDDPASFQTDDVEVLAVSCDRMYSLRAYAEHEGLSFPLLSDFWPHGAVATTYGVFDAERGVSERGTFVVDREGLLRWQVISPQGRARDVDDLRRALHDLGA